MGGTSERAFRRPLKAAAAGLAVAGLLVLVALAARGSHPGGEARLHQREVPAQVTNDLLTILVVGYVLATVVLLVALYSLRGEWARPRKSRWLRQVLMLVVLAVTVAFLATRVARTDLGDAFRRHIAEVQKRQTDTRFRAPTLPKRPTADKPAELDWVLAAVIGGGLVLAAVVLLARGRERPEPREEETVEEELSLVVADTIDDLRGEADARRAVIAAYARMERALAQHGHPRQRSEAPFEYLARVLLALRVRAGAVRDLTELFERAKFSTHEIDQPMKERAIAALVSVRDDLEAAPA